MLIGLVLYIILQMHLRRLRLRPHADGLFHITHEHIMGHQIKITTPYERFTRRGDRREAIKQTHDARELWKQIRVSIQDIRLVGQINLKLFTLCNVFQSKFYLSPVNEQ